MTTDYCMLIAMTSSGRALTVSGSEAERPRLLQKSWPKRQGP